MIGAGIPPTGVIGRNPDFQLLARSYGAAATQVRDAAALTAAVRAALVEPRPTLIEIIAADFTAAG
jgi:thiamine pyrophosphate-dependent acetolactate synthase large subunit-like protein